MVILSERVRSLPIYVQVKDVGADNKPSITPFSEAVNSGIRGRIIGLSVASTTNNQNGSTAFTDDELKKLYLTIRATNDIILSGVNAGQILDIIKHSGCPFFPVPRKITFAELGQSELAATNLADVGTLQINVFYEL
jgi:hypothetical protein